VRVHGFVSWAHYADHIVPVLQNLPGEIRGDLYCADDRLAATVQAAGLRVHGPSAVMPEGDPVIVAGFADLRSVRHRPVCLMEHGAGQTYVGVRDGAYAGGRGRDRVDLFLCPSGRVADRNRDAGAVNVEVVGSPRLDVLWLERQKFERTRDGNRVAVSWHWDCGLAPETGSTWDEWRDVVPGWVGAARCQVLGHGHPKMWPRLSKWWRRLGVEPVQDWVSVVRRADVFVCDNSSTMFEACAVGLPVVVMNGARYRRGVEHGLRFWEHAGMGPQISPGDDVWQAVEQAKSYGLVQGWVAADVYEHPPDGSGQATEAAVEAVTLWATR
jgi:hypothetical protein